MLKDIIPAQSRKKVYAAVALIGFILGAIQVGYAAAEVGQPVWLVVAFAVYGFTAAATGAAAAGNTPAPDDPTVGVDDDYEPRHLAD